MIQTARPFESFCFWIAGSFNDGAGPIAGGLLRSGACAATVTAATADSSTTAAVFRKSEI